MRVVYFGTAEFAVPALEAVSESVVLAVSQPDRPSGRGMRLKPSPVREAAERLGIPVATPEKARDPSFIQAVRELEPDLLLVAAYGQILRQALLDTGRQGAFNLHGSVLPQWRGAAPIQRCIESGANETGVTLMKMDAGMDTGDIVAVAKTTIGPDETADELGARLAVLAAELAMDWLPRLASGDYPTVPQDDSLATHAAKLTKEDCRLDVFGEAQSEYDKFRAVTSRPGAWIETRLGPVRVLEARLHPDATGDPGSVAEAKQGLVVAFRNGGLRLERVQAPGKGPVTGREFANGARLAVGDRFVP